MHTLFNTLFFVLIITFYSVNINHKTIVESYIEARNNYDISKIVTLVDSTYQEIYYDGTLEIKDITHLKQTILFGKEIDSKIKLVSLTSKNNTVTTLEENSNYIDSALGRKLRTFKISYTFKNGKILNQKIEPIKGHNAIVKFNDACWDTFLKFCKKHDINYQSDSMDANLGRSLKKALSRYVDAKNTIQSNE